MEEAATRHMYGEDIELTACYERSFLLQLGMLLVGEEACMHDGFAFFFKIFAI